MNKKSIFLTGLLAISAIQTILPSETEQSPKGLGTLCKTYAASLIPGGLIGFATGFLSVQAMAVSFDGARFFKQQNDSTNETIFGLFVPTMILIAEYRLRARLTNDLNQNLEKNAMSHNKDLIHDTAWVASWITFLSYAK